MHRITSLFAVAALCATFSAGCKKDDAAEAPAAEKGAEPEAAAEAAKAKPVTDFEVKAERVVVTSSLAPNATYAEQGLGLEATEGNVFVCAFYSLTNKGPENDHAGGLPTLVAADGTEYEVHQKAAGKLPSDWESTFSLAKIAPGASQSGPRCFEVPAEVAEGKLSLHFVDEGNMSGEGAWEETVELPAPEAAAAEGEEAAADEGDEAEGAEAAAGEEAAAE